MSPAESDVIEAGTGFEGESALTLVEQIFQRQPQEIHHHDVIIILGTKIVHLQMSKER
jgi:hypothetical protein